MKSRTVELAVGIFVVLFVLALFLLAMRVSGLAGINLGETYTLTAKFDNISGLKERAKVTISGVKVGQVTKIDFDPVADKAVVTMIMDKKLTTFTPEQMKQVQKNALEDLQYSYDYEQATPQQQKAMQSKLINNMKNITTIDQDAYIKVATNGIIGEKYLKVEPGGSFNYIPVGGSFPDTQTQGTIEIEDLVNKFITGSSGQSESTTSDQKAPVSTDKNTQTQPASAQTTADQPAFIE
ncbi:MCE family protein [Acinetobacter qingfengensis]|uniref:Mammalian cell entry protein n=1 Tax=Acinetobacter qingfengensis TaxID=1262585 RepID=A0A1E7R185_9GAMM|nr:MlaD family protein [Acinetobacter qingfengensis]KAA8733289.1 MCE family protein [Acinetobacter qingfengensis]OEY93080.1 mammalian cell entry protein [Acinetobacter qingfengensis]